MSRFRFTVFSVVFDALLVIGSVVVAFLIRFGGAIPQFNFAGFIAMAPIAVAGYLFSGWVYGLYEAEKIDTPWGVTRAAVSAATLGSLLMAAFAFFGGTATASFARWTLVIAWALQCLTFIGWRIAFLRWGTVRWPEQRIAILGISEIGQQLGVSLSERAKWGLTLVGYIRHYEYTGVDDPGALADAPALVLGDYSQLGELISTHKINRLIVADPVDLRELIETVALSDGTVRVAIDIVPDLYEILLSTTDSIVGDIPLMRVVDRYLPRYQRYTKRVIDLVGSLVFLVVLSPVLLGAALAIKLGDGGPVLYRQDRVGRNKKAFMINKFRTMRVDAEAQSGPVLASEDDPRVTRIGRFLRRARLDELPQIFNILRGEMSFIGPRPERPHFVEQFEQDISGYGERFRVLPGATGLAQVNGGYATTPELKLKYDLMYVYHQDLVMDLQIIVETLKVLLTGRGAR